MKMQMFELEADEVTSEEEAIKTAMRGPDYSKEEMEDDERAID
jgi:hypothetical protein